MCFSCFTDVFATELAPVCICFLAEEKIGGGSDRCCVPRWIWRCGGELKIMGKSNSKLKPEVVEELTRKTYCEYHQVFVFLFVFRKKILHKLFSQSLGE